MNKTYTLNILKYGNLSVHENININQLYNLLYKDQPINFSIVLYEITNNKVSEIYTKVDNKTKQVLLYTDNTHLKATITPYTKIKKELQPTFNNTSKNINFMIGTFEKGITEKKELKNIIQYLETIKRHDLKKYYILLENNPYIIRKLSKENYILINPYTNQENKLKYTYKNIEYLKYKLEKI